ncbi:MAG: N-acetyltransferase [Candidatus Andeanibacterium colombiense]|uniref:N-acetyltransferase n=1 Tax=Candidatus Andeanibacterium colombiense TaxID=3121345 RepID=A0AAJ6BNR1_9SPHN|nr:MAG: N-acetyltransferase [Sphingomonadaceae bacterium]
MTDAETLVTLIPLADVDPGLIEDVLDRAFGPGRFERTAYRVRGTADWLPALSFAAVDGDTLVGTIQTWPVALTDGAGKAHPLLMVGPVAVIPERQGEGIGQALMLAMLGALDHPELQGRAPLPQVLIGDADYYGRFFGFTAEPTGGWLLPGPWERDRLLVRAANPAMLPKEGMLGPWLG